MAERATASQCIWRNCHAETREPGNPLCSAHYSLIPSDLRGHIDTAIRYTHALVLPSGAAVRRTEDQTYWYMRGFNDAMNQRQPAEVNQLGQHCMALIERNNAQAAQLEEMATKLDEALARLDDLDGWETATEYNDNFHSQDD